MESRCAVENCGGIPKYRCGKCRIVFYCSQDHQKLHWQFHKLQCGKKPRSETSTNSPQCDETVEKRFCRCMFCGVEMALTSEEEAIQHMEVCPALQEQLDSKEQFTVPEVVKAQMKNNGNNM